MTGDQLQELRDFRLAQAQESLDAARLVLPASLFRETVNRSYYAMFYAVLALLVQGKHETSKHAGAISLFDRLFVKTGLFEKQYSQWLHETFDARLQSDYEPLHQISEELAREHLHMAENFVEAVVSYLGKP